MQLQLMRVWQRVGETHTLIVDNDHFLNATVPTELVVQIPFRCANAQTEYSQHIAWVGSLEDKVYKQSRDGSVSVTHDGGVNGAFWWRRSAVVGCWTFTAVRARPTGVGFLISRRSDRLSVCVGIRVD